MKNVDTFLENKTDKQKSQKTNIQQKPSVAKNMTVKAVMISRGLAGARTSPFLNLIN